MMSQLDYCGVDILLTKKGDFKFLEINPVPGFLQIEKLSGLNIAGELINLLK
jgi:glutathione synthase/RimK-type ligase-like ATP-grasp enzyme